MSYNDSIQNRFKIKRSFKNLIINPSDLITENRHIIDPNLAIVYLSDNLKKKYPILKDAIMFYLSNNEDFCGLYGMKLSFVNQMPKKFKTDMLISSFYSPKAESFPLKQYQTGDFLILNKQKHIVGIFTITGNWGFPNIYQDIDTKKYLKTKENAIFYATYIFPEYRKQGYSNKTTKYFNQLLHDKFTIYEYIAEDNIASIRSVAKLGFKLIGKVYPDRKYKHIGLVYKYINKLDE